MDPQKEFIEKNHTLIQQIYEGLVRFNPSGEIQPALAISWHRINPTTMEFNLRKDVTFHDGEIFDAESVKFSIERYLDPKTGFPALGFIQSLDDVAIINPYAVQINTRYPDSLLLNRLAGFIVMVPPKYTKEHQEDFLQTHPVGTGPFRFAYWKRNEEIKLERNQNYWDPNLPKLENLIFRFISRSDQIRQLLEGELDLVTDIPGTETLKIQQSKFAKIVKCSSLSTVAASFNLNSSFMKNIQVRRALNYGINKEDLIRYGLLGNGHPVNNLVLPDHPIKLDDSSLIDYRYDPVKARNLLNEAGYSKGVRIRLIEVKATRAAKIIAANFKSLGIDTDITSATDATIGDELKNNTWDIFLGYCPDPMHHPFFIHSIFLYSKSPYSLTRDKQLDSLIDAIEQELDPQKQEEKIKTLAIYVNQEALSLFTYQQIKTYGMRRDVMFVPSISGMPNFRDASRKN